MKSIYVNAVAKPFSQFPRGPHRFKVDGDTVRVWDDVAGHYTFCHVLSQRAQQRIRRLAREKGD